MHLQWMIICLLAYVDLSHQKSLPNLPTYLAAVVEYHSEFHLDSVPTLKENTNAYVGFIKEASTQNVDIIVFPEDGLTTYTTIKRHELYNWTTIIPAASDNFIPCINTTIDVSTTLRNISCAARENEIYVVINIAEQLPCVNQTRCREDNMFYYNSNVVFDRKGKIIARYRKANLFMEYNFDTTKEPEIVTFDTDFGVKFGTFTCFDILFYNPALQLTRHYNITDIVFPTAWFSEVPFLTAIQTQAGWSFAEDVNLLASGYNRPFSGSTGSGIYLGRKGVGRAIMSRIDEKTMLIFEVSKIKRTNESESYQNQMKDNNQQTKSYKQEHTLYESWNMQKNTTMKTDNKNILLEHDFIDRFETFLFQQDIKQKLLCQNSFCCEFTVSTVHTDPNIKYRLVVFSGTRKYGIIDASVSTCGIIQCLNKTIASCISTPKDSKTVFNEIEITAKFEDYKNFLIMPSTLGSDLLPLKKWAYEEHTHDNHVHVTISLNNNSVNNVVTFGLYARTFHENKNRTTCAFNTINGFVLLLAVWLLSRF